MMPDNIFHQQILKQSAVGVSGIIHLTDRERDTLGRGTACLHLYHSRHGLKPPPYLPQNITVLWIHCLPSQQHKIKL